MEPATKLVVIVGIHFMILFTAFSAFQTIVVKIHEDQGDYSLGPFIFSINYFVFMVTNLFVSRVRFSQKWQIVFATLGYALNYMTGFLIVGTPVYVKYIVAGLGAAVNGVGASFLWTSVGAYIHKVCHVYHKQSEKGHYFGLFNSIFCSSSVLGAIVVTFGLSLFETFFYFVIVSSIALFAFVFGCIFIKDVKTEQNIIEKQAKQGIFKSSMNSAKSTIKFYKVMKNTLGLIIIDGINIGVMTSTMLHLMPSGDDKRQNKLNAGICLILYGVGCLVGGYFGGKLCDHLRIRVSSYISLYLFLMTVFFSILASQIMQMWSARLACFCWGLVLYYLSANLMVICSRLYKGKSQSFALTKQLHSLVFVIYQVISMATHNSIPTLYLMLGILIFVVPAFWGVYRSPEQKIIQRTDQNKQSLKSQSQQLV